MIETGMQHFALRTHAPGRFSEEQLRSIDIPVLVIMAGASRMHDSAQAAGNADRLLAHGTVLVYGDASHAINGESPDRITADVAAFLNGRAHD